MSQRALDIHKVSDLVAEKKGDTFFWYIDDEEFKYRSGDDYLRSRASVISGWETWGLKGKTKTAANRKVFELVK